MNRKRIKIQEIERFGHKKNHRSEAVSGGRAPDLDPLVV